MTLLDWFPAITTTTLFAAAVWLARTAIYNRLTKSVQHEFDTKLETLRGQLRESEERLKADLRAKESEIAALRAGALSAMAARQIATSQRRLDAVDQLWSAVTALSAVKSVIMMMSVVNFDTAAARAEKDPNLRRAFEFMSRGFDMASLDLTSAQKARPYLSPMVWALYSALLAICLHASMRLQVLKSGVPAKEVMNDAGISKIIAAVLPEQAAFIERMGPSGNFLLVEQVEAKLLQELQAMLAGADADRAAVEQAAKILATSNEVITSVAAGQRPPS